MVWMNNRGTVIFYTIMLSVVLIVILLAMTPVVKTFVDDARGNTTEDHQGLDCTNSTATISNFQEAQCIVTDLATPYYFFGMLAIAGIVIGAKVLLGGGVTQ